MGKGFTCMIYKYATGFKGKLHKFENKDRSVLIIEVSDFMRKNNINFTHDTIARSIDRQSGLAAKASKTIGLAAAASGAVALVKNLAGVAVSNEEVVRRSSICASCPMITRIGGCGPCGAAGKISQWANKIRSGKGLQIQIPSEVKHSYCGFCQCALSLMVLTKAKDFHAESPGKNMTRPDICWLKTTSKNYTHE